MSIETIVLKAHSGWAYLLLIVLTIATINSLIGYFGKKEFGNKDFSLALVGLIVTHIQLLLGIALYVTPSNLARWDVEGAMGIPAVRLLILEHPLMMIIAVALLTIGYSKHKKKRVSQGKFKMLAIFYSLALIVVLSRLPWTQWLA
ncbi:hypothetical protein [Nonlabens xiamenensis]|uniref:hypothetical protein n=1 Tax=Nonlabens xiamenensis TaxID=2341043 RepID=UPI000F615CA1|nr:hypothetical protein [Nonlabens xiamenensis]